MRHRLMKKHGLLLQRYTGRRRPGEHDGKIITIRSNIRWCPDALEFTCWNDEIVRIAFRGRSRWAQSSLRDQTLSAGAQGPSAFEPLSDAGQNACLASYIG